MKIKTLIIEDTPIALLSALTILNNFNLEIDTASDGNEALRHLTNNKYHIIFLDLGLPDIDGIDIAKMIRNNNSYATSSKVTIVALTAHTKDEYKMQCEEAKFDKFLTKPLKEEDVKNIINNYTYITN